MSTSCDVLMKQNKKRQTLENAQNRLEVLFNQQQKNKFALSLSQARSVLQSDD